MAYLSLTLADLFSRMTERWEGVPWWDEEDARLGINEALRFWNLLTGRWHTQITMVTVAAQREYTLPTTLLYRTRLSMSGRPIVGTGLTDLDTGRPTWISETTSSGNDVPTRVTGWAPIDLRVIALWPTPMQSGLALTFDGVAATPTLAEEGDYLDLGEEDLSLLLDFALHVASFKRGGPYFAATLPSFTRLLRAAALENSRIKTSQRYRRALGFDWARTLQPDADTPTRIDTLPKSLGLEEAR